MWSCLGWLVGAGRGGCAGCRVVFSVCSSLVVLSAWCRGWRDGLVPGDAGSRAAATSGQALAAARPGRRRGLPALRVCPRVGLTWRLRRTAPGQPRGRAGASSWVEVNALWGR